MPCLDLSGNVYFITGASRGIGKAIALFLAEKGARIVVAAKTVEETDEKLPGTIHATVNEIEAAGGQALAVQLDVRNEQQIKDAIAATIETFGRLDGVINNAGALYLSDLESTRMKDHDLMHALNTRAVDMIIQDALPWLKLSDNPRILNISPPIDLDPGWFVFAYTRSKYAMSMATMGYAEQLKPYGIAVNSLWPETAIDTSAIRNKLGGDGTVALSRKPEFVALAAYLVLRQAKEITGRFFIDSQVVKDSGQIDLSRFRVDASKPLLLDFFIGKPPKTKEESLSRTVWPDKNGTLPPGYPLMPPPVVLASEHGRYAVVKVSREIDGYDGFIELSKSIASQHHIRSPLMQIARLANSGTHEKMHVFLITVTESRKISFITNFAPAG
jgi:citronellol/citronellal dehydrogenase